MVEFPLLSERVSTLCCSCCSRKEGGEQQQQTNYQRPIAQHQESKPHDQNQKKETTAPRRNAPRKAQAGPNKEPELPQQQRLVGRTSTVVEGFLTKFATGLGKNWKRRYFRLHRNGELEYFDDAFAVQSRGCLQLLDAQGLPQYMVFETEPAHGASKGHHFELQPVKESDVTPPLLLVAESSAKRDMWIDRISSGFARRSKPLNGPGRNVIAYHSSSKGGYPNGKPDDELGGDFGRQVLYKGFLLKEGHIVKSWKYRFFVLYENGLLAYYTRRSVDKLKGEMRLWTKGFPNVLKIDVQQHAGSRGGKHGFGWHLQAGHENLVLMADTAEDRDQWMYKIKLGIHNNCQDVHR